MSDRSDGSDGLATTGAVRDGEGSGSSSERSRLRQLTSKLIGFAVDHREALSTRRREATRPGRVYTDGPHGGESRPTGPGTTRAVRRLGRRWAGARCLVTGASSGLGRAIAEHLVLGGAGVVLTGRSTGRTRGDLVTSGAATAVRG